MSAAKIPVGYLTLDEAVILVAKDLSDQEASLEKNHTAAERSFIKRETAVGELHRALGKSMLDCFVCEAGSVFRVTAADWRGAVHWRESIISGIVRASIEAPISRHSGERLMVEQNAFKKWLKDRPRKRVDSQGCLSWLEAEMRNNPEASPKPKAEYLKTAKEQYGVSERRFNRLWDSAKDETGVAWKAGRRPDKLVQ